MSVTPVLPDQRPVICLAACLCIGLLSSCANSPTGKALERTFAADSKLKNNANVVSPSNTAQDQTVQLPKDFPTEI
ncbi:MAG: S-layer homology domain-containing protein, partial [Coleofasciculaceae cyanobacterium]